MRSDDEMEGVEVGGGVDLGVSAGLETGLGVYLGVYLGIYLVYAGLLSSCLGADFCSGAEDDPAGLDASISTPNKGFPTYTVSPA